MKQTHHQAEWIERAALADLHAAAAEAQNSLGLSQETIGDTFVSMATGDPSILLNRAIGLGVDQVATRRDVAGICARYDEAGVGRYFLHVHPEARPAELCEWLGDLGLVARRRWMKFARGREAAPKASTDLRIEEIGPKYGEAFGRIVAHGFDLTDSAVPVLAALIGRPGWHVFMSFAGDEPAGTGALFVDDGVGWLDWGATLPAFRRRGGQRAVLAARVRAALDLECHTILTETGESVEGDPQHSYHNILWAGFREAFLRDNYVLAL